jgi:hypothetical protein
MVAVVGMLACTRTADPNGPERMVYKVSEDGRRLMGYHATDLVHPVGGVALPPGAVWSVAGIGDAPQVWIHSDASVQLVDARSWQTLATWSRLDTVAPVQLAQRQPASDPQSGARVE